MRLGFLAISLIGCLAIVACQSPHTDSPAVISELRVLAIQANPPEGPPGADVRFQALVVNHQGTVSETSIEWTLCTHPRDVAENTSVAPECLGKIGDYLLPVETLPSSLPASTTIPLNACALFGSEPAPAVPGEPPNRPADPDATGGYYAPIRASLLASGDTTMAQGLSSGAIGVVRVRCALPAAPVDIARDYAARYSNNQNPQLVDLRIIDAQGLEQSSYSPGDELDLEGIWHQESAENFVIYDPLTPELIEATEALTVSWFATGGTFAIDRTRATSGTTRVRVQWSPPEEPRTVHFWAVLRDNRGGMSWRQLSLSPHQ